MEELGALNDFSLNFGICLKGLLLEMYIPVRINKIIIPDIKKYDRRDFIFYYFSVLHFLTFDMKNCNLYLEFHI